MGFNFINYLTSGVKISVLPLQKRQSFYMAEKMHLSVFGSFYRLSNANLALGESLLLCKVTAKTELIIFS